MCSIISVFATIGEEKLEREKSAEEVHKTEEEGKGMKQRCYMIIMTSFRLSF